MDNNKNFNLGDFAKDGYEIRTVNGLHFLIHNKKVGSNLFQLLEDWKNRGYDKDAFYVVLGEFGKSLSVPKEMEL